MKRGILLILLILIFPIVYAFCGDGKIDNTGLEGCLTCPEDNPCFIDSKCVDNECIQRLIPPIFLKDDPFATIIIPIHIVESLNEKFEKETEFVSCLRGKYADGVYQISKESQPEVLEESSLHIEHTGCPKIGTMATIHSHKDGNCNPSSADLFSFGRKKEPIMVISCGKDNFAFYSRADPEVRMNYLVRDVPEKENSYFLFYFPWFFSSVLIIVIGIIIYRKHKVIEKKNKEIAINTIGEFTRKERKLLNILIEIGELPRKAISSTLFIKLNKENLIETKGEIVKIKKWFRDALKA